MTEDSTKFTGFTTPDGEHLASNRFCFGLCNAPAHFMSATEGLFQHSINRYCHVYLDDVIIFSQNVSKHIIELRDTLQVLRRAGLKLNPAKCTFAQLKVKYLGHWFSGEGYGMDPKIVEAVRGFKEIKNARQAKSWLGLCGYYCKFCEGFSDIVAPFRILQFRVLHLFVQRSENSSRSYG